MTTRNLDIIGTGSTAGDAVLDASGTGALTIGGVSQSGTGTPTKTLALQGAFGGANTIAGPITDGTGVLSVSKSGPAPGRWPPRTSIPVRRPSPPGS
ncbi:MAG: hypothetical protein QM811_18145 [Pirellulales bacterium]